MDGLESNGREEWNNYSCLSLCDVFNTLFLIWVVVKIMVLIWIPIIIRLLIFRVPQKVPISAAGIAQKGIGQEVLQALLFTRAQ